MRASAPPGFAEKFRTVLSAVKTSASELKTGSSVRDVVDPLYGKRDRPAFDADGRVHVWRERPARLRSAAPERRIDGMETRGAQ
jgi:hypothetical protein